MVSSMGGNVEDDKGSDMVKMCKCLGVWKVMCKFVGL